MSATIHRNLIIKLKISVCRPTLTNSIVKLFMTGVAQKPQRRESDRMNEVDFTASSAVQISVFSSRVLRGEQREQCLGSALPLWHSLKEPCSADGHCLGRECLESYSQSVSVPSFEFIYAPFLNAS